MSNVATSDKSREQAFYAVLREVFAPLRGKEWTASAIPPLVAEVMKRVESLEGVLTMTYEDYHLCVEYTDGRLLWAYFGPEWPPMGDVGF